VSFEPDYLRDPEGSCLVKYGETWVLCTATVSEGTPAWLAGAGRGWVTAEYALLPRAVPERKDRRIGGREKEIGRLIGRALRASVDLPALTGFTITIDCDVLQADGGTRCASVSGGFVALHRALSYMRRANLLKRLPVRQFIAGVSVVLVEGELLLDPDYEEDCRCAADGNFVIAEDGGTVEVQVSAEEGPFPGEVLSGMISLAEKGTGKIISKQKEALK